MNFSPTNRSIKRNILIGSILVMFPMVWLFSNNFDVDANSTYFIDTVLFIGSFMLFMRGIFPFLFNWILTEIDTKSSNRLLESEELGFVMFRAFFLKKGEK